LNKYKFIQNYNFKKIITEIIVKDLNKLLNFIKFYNNILKLFKILHNKTSKLFKILISGNMK